MIKFYTNLFKDPKDLSPTLDINKSKNVGIQGTKRHKSRHMAADTLQIKISNTGFCAAEFISAIRLFNTIMHFVDAAGLRVSGVISCKTFYARQ